MLENNKVNDETREKLAFLGNLSTHGRRDSEVRNVPLDVINELETTGKFTQQLFKFTLKDHTTCRIYTL